jgi:pimeloyl-ACP methyl ester carboxylesterase
MPELVTADGLALNYEEWGDPEAPAVVLLHGFTSDLRMWRPHVDGFSRDYRVIAPDLRGHGHTSAPEDLAEYTMERYAEDLRALLDALTIDVCALVGCSFGGMVAVHFATEHPERIAGLVLSDTSAAYDHPAYNEAYRKREAAMRDSEQIVDRFGTAELGKRAAANVSDSFLAAGMRARYARLSREGFLGAAKVRRERPNLLPVLRERLTMPVLVCTGTDDPVHSASLVMAAELPGARVVTFKDTGHGIPGHRPEAFVHAVLAFLNDIEEGKPIAGNRTVQG